MRPVIISGLALSLTVLLGACNPSPQASSAASAASGASTAATATGGNSLAERIASKGTITVGTEGTYAPFSFHDASGKLTGFDVAVTEEVAKRLGVKVEFKETQWDAMFAGLNSNRFDLIANQVGINDERKQKYDFSTPYTYSGAVVVTRADDDRVKAFADLKGLSSAQSLTSNFGKMAEGYGAKLVGVDGLAQAIELLKQKRVDVTINDQLAVLDYTKTKGDTGLKIVLRSDDKASSAFAFNKGNEAAVKQFDQALESMRQDGTLSKLAKEWFGEDVSVK